MVLRNMRVGVVSDVHNNVEALTYALDHLRDCDVVLSLGDLVSDYRVSPAILDMARDAQLLGIAGNHEKSVLVNPGSRLRESLASDDLAYLQALPATRQLELDGRRILLAHGAPWDDPASYRCQYVLAHDTASLERIADGGRDLVLLGHTHVPMARRIKATLVLNPGSCGEARGREGQLTYGRLDTRLGAATVFGIRPGTAPERLLDSEF